jgi:RNA polymerase sigma-70 factor (ECF subfamily)
MLETTGIEHLSDSSLVKAALADSHDFLHLMRRYERRLLNYIQRISGLSLLDAEDVLQEAFIKIYQNLRGFDTQLKFSSWAYRITRNEVINDFRKRKTRRLFYFSNLTDDLLFNLSVEDGMPDKIDLKQKKEELIKALNSLDEKYREVLELKFFEGHDYNEISDILKKPVGTVGTLINRAKKKLKTSFRPTGGSGGIF